MKKFNYIVRCYVLKKGDLYFAACITLNLTATGNTIDKAKSNLEEVIKDYIELAVEGKKPEEFAHLLNRPVPFSMYFEYTICFIIYHAGITKDIFTFNEDLPLVPIYTF